MKKNVHVVGAIIENGKHEIFCALRNPNMVLANYWEFPGGKIEEGESPEQALTREILEEFNCSILQGEPVLLEHTAIRWVPRHELLNLNFAPADIPAINKILAEK